MEPLYMFIDESGNLRDLINGHNNETCWILTVMSTPNPFEIGASLLNLRYRLLQNRDACGKDMQKRGAFHASQDPQGVREAVFEILQKHGNNLRIDSVIVERKSLPSKLQDIEQEADGLYCQLGKQALQHAFFNDPNLLRKYRSLVIIMSNPYGNEKACMRLAGKFESVLKEIALDFPFVFYSHYAPFDICNQAVDYFSWAIFKKWRKNDQRYYDRIRQSVKSELYWEEESSRQTLGEGPLG